jgi:hypothetical protein
MKRKIALSVITLVVLAGAFLTYIHGASSSSFSPNMAPPLMINVNSTSDILSPPAGVVTLRSAIVAANADPGANPVIINLQPGTTYNLTLANATQENAAASGDLDITTSLHTVTIVGGGSSGPNATIIDAAGLNTGSMHDRAFQITGSGVAAIFQDLVIQNGQAADDGTSGASTDPSAQNTIRDGGGILNNGGSVTLTNVVVRSCQALGKGDTVVNDHTTLDAQGGGIASLGATGAVVITDSTLTGNAATGGNGGNFNGGNGSAARGGSIYFEGGTLNITGSRVDTSAANGGNGGSVSQDGMENGGFGGLAQGGGVWLGSGGTATINNTTFESTAANGGHSGTGGNSSGSGGEADGGGIYSLGSVTVSNSTFHLAGATGGTAANAVGHACFGAHDAGDGGAANGAAIFADGGSLIVDTSTFANNNAAGGNGGDGGEIIPGEGGHDCGQHGRGGTAFGGAITNNTGTVNIHHSTISLNNAQAGNSGVNEGAADKPARLVAEGTGGGIRVGAGSVTLDNTIVAGNTAASGTGDTTGAPTPGPDVDGTVTSNGHNLAGNTTSATGFTGTGDLTGVSPMLSPLADNGGPTHTMALMAGSPAIDAGVASGAMFDQRGMARTFDDPSVVNAPTSDGTDIGAFERVPPCILTCPSDITVPNDLNQCGAVVTYTAPSGASCGTVTCVPPSGHFFPVGTTTVTCTSSVGPTCSFKVTVKDAQAPNITCPANITVNASPGACSATVTFTVTATDNCSVPVVVSSPPSGSVFALGTTTVHSTATDAAGNQSTCSFTVTVKDVTPPVITTSGQTIALWPPNHKYQTIKVTDLVTGASDLCDPSVTLSSVTISMVTSDEPDNSEGDGNTTHDIVIAADCKSVQLRAERQGNGNGRVYTITFKVTDAFGNVGTATAKVTVPHSQNGSPAIDDGPHYTVLGGCP